MKKKSIQTLQIIVVVLQALALVIALGFTAIQQLVKSVFTSESEALEIFSVPLQSLTEIIPLLLLYVMGLLFVGKLSASSRKTVAGVLLGIAIFLQIVLQYEIVFNILMSKQGIDILVSYNALESAISLITNPLTGVAFALFCFSCGGCFGAEVQR